jgi:hypothetical protein
MKKCLASPVLQYPANPVPVFPLVTILSLMGGF